MNNETQYFDTLRGYRAGELSATDAANSLLENGFAADEEEAALITIAWDEQFEQLSYSL